MIMKNNAKTHNLKKRTSFSIPVHYVLKVFGET